MFACGDGYEDLCRARPDGSGLEQLSKDGDASRSTDGYYRAAALTRDGRTLAYVYASDVFVHPLAGGPTRRATAQFSPLLIRFRPDGARFAVAELSAVVGGTQVCTYNTDLSGNNEGRYCVASGVSSGMDYLLDGRLLMSRIPRAFTALKVARRQAGGRVRGRVRIARAGSRVTVELLRGGRRVGREARRSAKKGQLRFAVRLRGRPGRVTLRITVTPRGAGPDTATRTVRVSR